MGTLWLAALRATAGDGARWSVTRPTAAQFRELFERGSAGYDAALFTGEYYRQVLDPADRREFQWESGCLSDQLIGQWWAHQLDLGYLLPRRARADRARRRWCGTTCVTALRTSSIRSGCTPMATMPAC